MLAGRWVSTPGTEQRVSLGRAGYGWTPERCVGCAPYSRTADCCSRGWAAAGVAGKMLEAAVAEPFCRSGRCVVWASWMLRGSGVSGRLWLGDVPMLTRQRRFISQVTGAGLCLPGYPQGVAERRLAMDDVGKVGSQHAGYSQELGGSRGGIMDYRNRRNRLSGVAGALSHGGRPSGIAGVVRVGW